jgi:hypothetical protein
MPFIAFDSLNEVILRQPPRTPQIRLHQQSRRPSRFFLKAKPNSLRKAGKIQAIRNIGRQRAILAA